eukprot:COSAG02_NODE_5882_length_3965_cov_11.810657_1_plen_255_part_00
MCSLGLPASSLRGVDAVRWCVQSCWQRADNTSSGERSWQAACSSAEHLQVRPLIPPIPLRLPARMLDVGRASHVQRGSCVPKASAALVQRRPAKKPAPRTLSCGVAQAMHCPQVLLRPIDPSTSVKKTLLANIDFPFSSSSTSRLDYGLPSADAYTSDFEDLKPTKPRKSPARSMPRVPKHRPQRRSWSGDPFARRALRGRNTDRGGGGNVKGASSSPKDNGYRSSRAERRAGIDNTLTWRGAKFPWVSRFAVQ